MTSIGIDLGGTNIAAAIVDEEGKVLRQGSTPTLREREAGAIVGDMAMLCLDLMEKQGLQAGDIHSIGIGSPGIVDNDRGMVVYANNLPFRETDLRSAIQSYINVPVYMGNDANVAAYGEYSSGAGKIYDDLVAITLGTGVGGGVIVHGEIITGSFNAGAELGHIVMKKGGNLCTCGRKGCWETYSSATAIIRDAREAAKAHPESLLNRLVGGDLEKMNAKVPFDAAQAGDPAAQAVVDSYIDDLATGLMNIVNIFQPQVIVLGGGVSAQKDNLLVPLREKMVGETYGGEEMLKTVLKVAELGNDAGLIGAAMLYRLYDKA
ncbi:ROK family protein [Anaerotalea alkaliphila]|uniref:Glucokinase n=1 Tax=Anaerotalea alkaliphila TaxID=2662126 RepID=A0A7X5KMZ2_9FIRM|nr:ROK family glucokinase [Anaerotalea alkaliphila]NDL67218.1 ROK family glucokinase [Anaerotalea alkaliphila]